MKVMHYIGGSYKDDHGFLDLCSDCRSIYDNMSWASIKAGKKMCHNSDPFIHHVSQSFAVRTVKRYMRTLLS